MQAKRKVKKRKSSFNPDVIVTTLHQAVHRDLKPISSVFGPKHPIARLANDQRKALTKKYVSPLTGQDHLVSKTYQKFLDVNEHIANYTGDNFVPPVLADIPDESSLRAKALFTARALISAVLTDFDEEELFTHCRNGPGSTNGVGFKDTSDEAKLTFPITLTKRVAPLFDRYLQFNFQLAAAVRDFNSQNPVTDRYSFVEGSRASTVEKNDEILRIIAKEPTGNMFIQQGLMIMMYHRMVPFGLDVRVLPEQHKVRAMISSITSGEATVDWRSASDCNAYDLLKWLMPPKWFAMCDMVRSPVMNINGKDVHLNMFSTMGNAVTFPLETLVFWAIGQGVRYALSGRYKSTFLPWNWDYSKISVFGDDCIIPTDMSEDYISVLGSVGFLINADKSFYREQDHGFRESCGGDYLHGYDVRPYSLKAPSSTAKSSLEPWLYIIFNRLKEKYITCFGRLSYVYEKGLWREMERLFVEHNISVKIVPDDYPDDSGLKWSQDLERLAKCYPRIKFSRISRSRHGTYAFNYCRFIYRERKDRFEYIHFVKALQVPAQMERSITEFSMDDIPMFRKVKRKGGYVEAKGLTCHWHVPNLNR